MQKDPMSSTIPFYKMKPPLAPAETVKLDITFAPNATGVGLFYMNGKSSRGNYDHPVLLLAKLGNTSYPFDPEMGCLQHRQQFFDPVRYP